MKDEKRRKHKKCKTKCDKKYYRRRRAYITVLTELTETEKRRTLTETEKRRTITETNSTYTLD